MSGASMPTGSGSEPVALLQRVRSEFLEMPGLRLTAAQAARLWALDRQTSERVLAHLTEDGFLSQNSHGAYHRVTEA